MNPFGEDDDDFGSLFFYRQILLKTKKATTKEIIKNDCECCKNISNRIYSQKAHSELNYILDRNSYIAKMMAVEVADQYPRIGSIGMTEEIPHTKASFSIPVRFT